MSTQVDLATEVLARRQSLPPGGGTTWIDAADGARLRVMRWPAAPGKPSVIFLNGRADFIEKYSEAYWHWRSRGFGLVTMDWRGQGLSSRAFPDAVRYFDTWIEDLETVLASVEPALADAPCVLAGHSMGAHLALRWLAQSRRAKRFLRAVLFAPMAGIVTYAIPPNVLGGAASAMVAIGRGSGFPPGQEPYGVRYRSAQRQRILTSDIARFGDEGWWIDANPDLATGGATWRWIADALASCTELAAPGVPESIGLPVDVFMGSGERLVSTTAALAIVRRLPKGRWHLIPGGAHELLRERDDIQNRLHREVDSLIEDPA